MNKKIKIPATEHSHHGTAYHSFCRGLGCGSLCPPGWCDQKEYFHTMTRRQQRIYNKEIGTYGERRYNGDTMRMAMVMTLFFDLPMIHTTNHWAGTARHIFKIECTTMCSILEQVNPLPAKWSVGTWIKKISYLVPSVYPAFSI